jgi:DNA-binding transcriptional regulator YiaG
MISLDPDNLRRVRLGLGWTMAQIGAALHTPAASWKNWESGRTRPPPCLAVALACIVSHPPARKL